MPFPKKLTPKEKAKNKDKEGPKGGGPPWMKGGKKPKKGKS